MERVSPDDAEAEIFRELFERVEVGEGDVTRVTLVGGLLGGDERDARAGLEVRQVGHDEFDHMSDQQRIELSARRCEVSQEFFRGIRTVSARASRGHRGLVVINSDAVVAQRFQIATSPAANFEGSTQV